jgi:hypothetical protein
LSQKAHIPQLRAVAMSLLVVATGDNKKIPEAIDIVHNAAFRYSLELIGSFPGIIQNSKGRTVTFRPWLSASDSTQDFFIFCGRLLDAIDRRVRGRHEEFDPVPEEEPSSYDHAAFLAVAQTLCRAAGVRGAKFPPIGECFSTIAEETPRQLQESFLKNYLGNVMQDYFDGSRARATLPSLPPETEGRLRSEDAAELVKAVFSRMQAGNGPVNSGALQQTLQHLIAQVWLAESALDD